MGYEFNPFTRKLDKVGTGGGAGGTFSAGVSTIGNTLGNTGMVTNQMVLAGGNNITLSQVTGAGGATVTIQGGAGGAGGIANAAGTQTATSGTVVYSNSNNVSFGMSNSSVVTASASFNQTVQTQGLVQSLNGSSGQLSLATGSSLSSSQNGSTITFGLASNITTALQSAGAYLTTAMQSNAATISNINFSAGTTSSNLSALTFADSNGVSFGLGTGVNAGKVTATVATNYQSQGAYLTTARASTDAVGLNTAKTNVTWTVNSSGISLDGGAYLTVQSNQTLGLYASSNTTGQSSSSTFDARTITFRGAGVASVGMSAGEVVISVPSGGGAGDGVNILAAGTQTAATTGTVLFNNSNGITFGMSNSSVITASHNGITSQTVQPVAVSGSNGSFAFSTATFGSSNGMHFYTTNGSVVGSYTVPTVTNSSFSVQDSATTINPVNRIAFSTGNNITLTLSTGASSATVGVAHNLAGTSSGFAGNLISGSMTHNSSGLNLSLNHPAWLTTAAQSSASNVSGVIAATASNGATNQTAQLSGAISFANGSGVSFFTTVSGATSGIAATVQTNYLTTARASTDAIGLNTAVTNVTATINSSGFSLNASGYAGVGTSATNASITLNSNGLAISVAAPGGGAAATASASNGSFTFGTLAFSNANNVTFGTSAGGIVTASVAAPGAAAENNWFALTGANTAGNTTASGSTIGLSGINLTLSGTNGSGINISAPATSSLSATGLVSISTNGSTISIGVAESTYNSSVFGLGNRGATGSISLGQNSLYFWPHVQELPLQGSIIKMPVLVTLSSSAAGAFTRGHTASFAVYSRSSNNSNSTALTRIYSTSYTAAAVMSSNANMSISIITAVGNSTSYSTVAANSAGLNLSLSVHGAREFIMPFNSTMTDGEYWFAYAQSSSSAGGVGNVFNVSHSVMSAATVNRMGLSTAASNDGIEKVIGMGTYSATSGSFPSSLPITDIRGGATFPIVYFLQGTV